MEISLQNRTLQFSLFGNLLQSFKNQKSLNNFILFYHSLNTVITTKIFAMNATECLISCGQNFLAERGSYFCAFLEPLLNCYISILIRLYYSSDFIMFVPDNFT